MSSHIILIFQTCCGLIFLRRDAPKPYKVPEGTRKDYSLFVHVNSLDGLGDEVWGDSGDIGHQPFHFSG